ncbi:MAG: hypothetical protein M0R32_11130 [Candidatus Cloacimonetes bacterium]|nr:hypothetical protein [Candidatus Cloacimonadota bacterium]
MNKPVPSFIPEKMPSADIAICSACGWKGPSAECETEQEGDFEYGYYDVHLCPKCEDGGLIEDYEMSKERIKEYEAWDAANHKETRGPI